MSHMASYVAQCEQGKSSKEIALIVLLTMVCFLCSEKLFKKLRMIYPCIIYFNYKIIN